MIRNRPTARIVRGVVALLSFLIAIIYLSIHFGLIDLVKMFPNYWTQRNKKILLSLLDDPTKAYDFEYGDLSSVGCKVKIGNKDWHSVLTGIKSRLIEKGYYENQDMAEISESVDGLVTRMESKHGRWFVMLVYSDGVELSDGESIPPSDYYSFFIINTSNQTQ